MTYRNHDVKLELKKIVDLDDEAEQAEALADLERRIELENESQEIQQESQEIELRFKKKGVDLGENYSTISTLEQLTEEVREHVKPVSTAKRLYNYAAGKVKRNLKKSAVVAATFILTSLAGLTYNFPSPSKQTSSCYPKLEYRYRSVKNKVLRPIGSNYFNETIRKLDSNCDKIITIKEFVSSYKEATASDLGERWKINPIELEEKTKIQGINTSRPDPYLERRDINCWEGERCLDKNTIMIQNSYIFLGNLSEMLPEPDCKTDTK